MTPRPKTVLVAQRIAALLFFLRSTPRTRSELAHLMGLPENTNSITYISRLLRVLIDEGLVTQVGRRVQGPGRQPEVYAFNPNF